MRIEKLDPPPRSETAPPEKEKPDTHGEVPRKQREIKDDGRYIIFYDFEDGDA
jgi:hypothetical protein